MNAADVIGYKFHADLYCARCGEQLPDIDPEGNDKAPIFATSETDTPYHCSTCGEFIPESWTDSCCFYVEEALRDFLRRHGEGSSLDTLLAWAEHGEDYGGRLGRVCQRFLARAERYRKQPV